MFIMWDKKFLLIISAVFVLLVCECRGVLSEKVVCYYQGSNGVKLAPPEELDASLCTHINYAFIQIDKNGNLTEQNPKIDIGLSMFTRVTSLKKLNPDLKVLLSVGDTAATVFSKVAADPQKRQNFVLSAKHFIQTYSFDGLDIDWEKPEPEDAESFLALLEELKKEFENFGWTLSAAVYPNPSNGYNTTEIVKYLDFLNLMTYNYFGGWSIHTGQNSPLFKSSLDSPYEKTYLNVAASINFWLAAGVPKDKLVVGLAFYGRSFTLADADDHGLHAPVTGAGVTPSATYRQICTSYSNWTTVWDDEQKNPYKYLDDQWLGYDDERSILEKIGYIKSQNLGGVMVWHIGGDDITGECGKKQGLLKLINEEFNDVKQTRGIIPKIDIRHDESVQLLLL